MGRQKIWYSKILHIPVAIPSSVASQSADMTKRIMLAKKLILTQAEGFTPEGLPSYSRWSVYSSSIGTPNLGSALMGDRWGANVSNVWSTVTSWPDGEAISLSASTAHPWCVLKAPPQLAYDSNIPNSEVNFYMSMYKGTTTAGETPMGLTFKYREPTRVDNSLNSPMFSDYIDGLTASDPYAWGFANEANSQTRVMKSNITGSWKHTYGVSGLSDVRMLMSVADDGSYIMVLLEQGPMANYHGATDSVKGVAYIEGCVKIPASSNIGTQPMKPTHNIITFSQPSRIINSDGVTKNVHKEYPHVMWTPGNSNSTEISGGLYNLGGSSTSNGFHAAKLAYSNTSVWGDNQVVKASPAWPLGYGNFYNISDSLGSDSVLPTVSETRSISTIIKNDSLTDGFIGFPYYAMYGGQVQTGALNGVGLATPYPLCEVPDIYVTATSIPPGTLVVGDGEYWLSVADLLIPVGSDTTLS